MAIAYLILQREEFTPAGSTPIFASLDEKTVEDRYAELIRIGAEDIYIDEVELH